MATHYLSSSTTESTTLYRVASSNTANEQVLNRNNQTVTLIEEFEGVNCEFNLVQLNNRNVYVKTENLFRLSGTPPSAPHTCSFYYNSNYLSPDWIALPLNIPFYDAKQTKYQIPILTNYKTISNQETFEKESIKQGTIELLKYYNKDTSDRNVSKLLSYYKFADFEDLYVRPISNTRIKALVSVPAKYFNAEPSFPNVLDIESGVEVFNLSTKDLRKKLQYIKTIFEFFNKSLTITNTTIENFSLLNEYDKIISFYEQLLRLFELNDLVIKDNVDETLEIVLDNCGRFFAASLNNGENCNYAVVGLSTIRNNEYARNPRTLNFIKNIDSMYLLDPCRISIAEFFTRYVLYPPNVQSIAGIKPLAELYNFNELLSFVTNTVNKLNSVNFNTKTTQEYEDMELEKLKEAISNLKKSFSWSSFYDKEKDIFNFKSFSKDLEKIDNMKKEGSKYDKFAASMVPEDTKQESANRRSLIKNIYNVLTLNQILCKLTPKAFECLFAILATTIGEVAGIDATLTLVTVSNYSIQEIRTKVFPYLNAEEKKIILNELFNRFCLTKHDLITILKQTKNLSIRESQLLYSNSFEQVKQKLLSEITV
jgi:hypothetical protein